jgi:exopolysaccharide biosynthesis protein
MKNLSLFLLLFCFSTLLKAQMPIDKQVILNAKWEKTKLGKRLTWQHFHFSEKQLFQSNQNIHFLEVKNGSRRWQFQLVSAGDSLVKTSDLALKAGATAAVNGSFFDIKNGGAVDFIKIDGRVLDTSRLDARRRLTFHQKSAIVVHNNKVSIARQTDSSDVKFAEKLNFDNVLVTGPLLLWKGDSAPLSKIAFNDNRHPRTCGCVTEKNDLILLTADGRTAQAQGLNLHELAFLMRTLGCRDAVNFDGGGSTTLFVAGQPANGVVNMPCDNKLFDHEGERKVSNIFILKKK